MKAVRSLSLVLLSPLLLGLTVALGVWMVASVRATYEPTAEITLSDYSAGANADVTMTFDIPPENLLFDSLIMFYPPQWGIAAGDDVDVGTVVGGFSMDSTHGLLNGACSNDLSASCEVLNSAWSPLSGIIIDPDDMFDPVCPGGQERAVCQWPDFLSELFPDLTPRARYYCHAGSSVVNILVFEPGTGLYGVDFPASWGYGSVTVVNDPTASDGTPTPSPITASCSPLSITETIYGAADGVALRTNPSVAPGDFIIPNTFRVWSRGAPDGDGDGYENAIDTCPFDVNVDGSPGTPAGDPDGDGIDSACDPHPAAACWPGAPGLFNDCDGDSFYNRGDNCPLIANANQADADNDRVGDACDPDPDDPYGYPGQDFTSELDVDISGPAGPTPSGTATATPTPSPTPGVTGTPTPAVTGTPTSGAGTVGPGETCAPVIPATYNGLVRLNGVPAASGYEIIASIGTTEWGSAVVSGGRYAIDVPQKLPAGEPCFAGSTIAFFVNGAMCTPVQEWSSGLHDVDLSCVTVATPTPVAPTPGPASPTTVAPTATPAELPPGGGGGLVGDRGLPVWAIVVVGWAGLTALAGFGTLAGRFVGRKR
jgi:hypothetical protein